MERRRPGHGSAAGRKNAGRARIGGSLAILVAALSVGGIAAPRAAAVPPAPGAYQADDSLGFRNVLPPGQSGFASFLQILESRSIGGTYPPHTTDQLSLYADLVHQGTSLSEAQVDQQFKDASFGVAPGDVERTYTPDCAVVSEPSPSSAHCDDVTIVRDAAYGVPHIYGADRAGAMFGIGYATAEDRLFAMDAERAAGRAELSSFLGGANVEMDRETWRGAPYTEADLELQFERADDLYGADGAQVQADVVNYIDGINQRIAEIRLDRSALQPGEYQLIGRPGGAEPFKPTDVIATASLVAGIFGKGGGREVDSALILEQARERFGKRKGRRVWADFRREEDAEAPTTVHETAFPYQEEPADPQGTALPDPGSTVAEDVVASTTATSSARAQRPVLDPLTDLTGGSNAMLVSAAESESGRPLAVMGPQVGYFSPSVLVEQDVHAPASAEGPALDARGVAFAGANLYVQLGRGRDYAWSATSAGQDIVDTYAVELCEPGGGTPTLGSMHYRFAGECLPFEVLEKTNAWQPNAGDSTPAGTETLRALRSKLGIVTHRATVRGAPVAYTQLRATYFHEADSSVGFADWNNPDAIHGAADFQQAAGRIDYTFNWFYADSEQIAYFNSGANPVRPAHVSRNFPVAGEPQNLWQGFDPGALSYERAPASAHPQVVDQAYLTSWNNKQAPGYRAADDTFSYGPVHRVDSLDERIEALIAGEEKASRAELVGAMNDAATVDLRGSQVLKWALRVVRSGKGPVAGKRLRKAVRTLHRWRLAGAHRLDADRSGRYDHPRAIRLMDAWWPRLVAAQFKPRLGGELYRRLKRMITVDDAAGPVGSAYISGWYGYVEKDLRAVLGARVGDRFSREYCGGGKLRKCRRALAKSLRKARRKTSNDELGYSPPCEGGDRQWCADAIEHSALGALTQRRIPWVNRPTFQQVVEVGR
jgi:acyl-homoserine lactone acylase PvdQ